MLRTPFFNVFKVKKLKEGRSTLPRSFSRLAVVQLLGGCILYLTKRKRKKHRKTAWTGGSCLEEILFLFGFAIAISKKNPHNKTKNSRQFWSHALRYVSLITCRPNSFLIGQMSNRDRTNKIVKQRSHLW